MVKDEPQWDFLGHGYLDHHDDSGRFGVSQLSPRQMRALHDFLQEELPEEEKRSAIAPAQLESLLATK